MPSVGHQNYLINYHELCKGSVLQKNEAKSLKAGILHRAHQLKDKLAGGGSNKPEARANRDILNTCIKRIQLDLNDGIFDAEDTVNNLYNNSSCSSRNIDRELVSSFVKSTAELARHATTSNTKINWFGHINKTHHISLLLNYASFQKEYPSLMLSEANNGALYGMPHIGVVTHQDLTKRQRVAYITLDLQSMTNFCESINATQNPQTLTTVGVSVVNHGNTTIQGVLMSRNTMDGSIKYARKITIEQSIVTSEKFCTLIKKLSQTNSSIVLQIDTRTTIGQEIASASINGISLSYYFDIIDINPNANHVQANTMNYENSTLRDRTYPYNILEQHIDNINRILQRGIHPEDPLLNQQLAENIMLHPNISHSLSPDRVSAHIEAIIERYTDPLLNIVNRVNRQPRQAMRHHHISLGNAYQIHTATELFYSKLQGLNTPNIVNKNIINQHWSAFDKIVKEGSFGEDQFNNKIKKLWDDISTNKEYTQIKPEIEKLVANALQFCNQIPNESERNDLISNYVISFLGDAATAYGNSENSVSCSKGILERAQTALYNICMLHSPNAKQNEPYIKGLQLFTAMADLYGKTTTDIDSNNKDILLQNNFNHIIGIIQQQINQENCNELLSKLNLQTTNVIKQSVEDEVDEKSLIENKINQEISKIITFLINKALPGLAEEQDITSCLTKTMLAIPAVVDYVKKSLMAVLPDML